MPKEVMLADGSMETVYGEDEVKEFKTQAEQAKEAGEQLNKLRTEMGVQEGQTLEEKLAEMKETANPNFAKFRKKFDGMERELKAIGKEFDQDGNVISGGKQLTPEELNRMVEESTRAALSQTEREQALSQFSSEDRKVIEPFLVKLEATGGSLQENLDLAVSKAFPGRTVDPIKNIINVGSGGAPRFSPQQAKSFSESDEGKSMLGQIVPPTKK